MGALPGETVGLGTTPCWPQGGYESELQIVRLHDLVQNSGKSCLEEEMRKPEDCPNSVALRRCLVRRDLELKQSTHRTWLRNQGDLCVLQPTKNPLSKIIENHGNSPS